MWALIVLVPDHCLSFYFDVLGADLSSYYVSQFCVVCKFLGTFC